MIGVLRVCDLVFLDGCLDGTPVTAFALLMGKSGSAAAAFNLCLAAGFLGFLVWFVTQLLLLLLLLLLRRRLRLWPTSLQRRLRRRHRPTGQQRLGGAWGEGAGRG